MDGDFQDKNNSNTKSDKEHQVPLSVCIYVVRVKWLPYSTETQNVKFTFEFDKWTDQITAVFNHIEVIDQVALVIEALVV